MILKTFIFEATLRHKAPEDLVTLKCATCGETEVRVKHNLYTGHMHDRRCCGDVSGLTPRARATSAQARPCRPLPESRSSCDRT